MSEPVEPPPDKRPPPAGPDSFARIFLEGLAKYRKQSGRHLQTATEEAASNLAQRTIARAPTYGLELRSPRAIVETIAMTVGVPFLGFIARQRRPVLPSLPLLVDPLRAAPRRAPPWIHAGVRVRGDARPRARHRLAHALRRRGSVSGRAFVGLIAVAMLVGQFSDVWKREIMRLDAGFDVLAIRTL